MKFGKFFISTTYMPFGSLSAAASLSASFGTYGCSSPSAAAFCMNGGSVTSTSACVFDFSLAMRSATPLEPASMYWTLMPVALVNAANWSPNQLGLPSCRPSAA